MQALTAALSLQSYKEEKRQERVLPARTGVNRSGKRRSKQDQQRLQEQQQELEQERDAADVQRQLAEEQQQARMNRHHQQLFCCDGLGLCWPAWVKLVHSQSHSLDVATSLH